MLLKIGTNYSPHEELLPLLKAAEAAFKKHDQLMVITSLKDREHSPGSKHYIGKAFDVRTKHIKDSGTQTLIFSAIQQSIRGKGIILQKPTHWHIQVSE